MLDPKMLKSFNDQINAELYSAYLYLSMSSYFHGLNLKGFANWMRVQAKEELGHAMKIFDHVIERGGRTELSKIDTPPKEWSSIVEVFQKTVEHEKHVTSLIHNLVKTARESNDYASEFFLQWFVSEQVEEEASAQEILDEVEMIKETKNGIFMLDRELGKRK
ncbi:ferritin [candidate division WOR-3 bacterium]|nr:ferritin [candidate division WOR-3 bacterium]